MFNIQAAVAAAAAVGPNMNEATAGGDFERELPAAGLARLRLITYIELGIHATTFEGKEKKKERVTMQFELSGPKHPLIVAGDNTFPHVITINESLSLAEKANFYKLFARMNYTGQHTTMAQMLGESFLGEVVHVKDKNDPKKVYANLKTVDGSWTIKSPLYEDPISGQQSRIEADRSVTPLKCFIWDAPVQLKEMWDSLFIDGTWPDRTDAAGVVTKGKSKNYYQNRIRAALNFAGSKISDLVITDGVEPDVGDAEKPVRTDPEGGAKADPLAGM